MPLLATQVADSEQRDQAAYTFDRLNLVLGTIVGETAGYLLTAAWTTLVPVGVPGVDAANFVGYVLWSLWLIAFAVAIWRSPVTAGDGKAGSARVNLFTRRPAA